MQANEVELEQINSNQSIEKLAMGQRRSAALGCHSYTASIESSSANGTQLVSLQRLKLILKFRAHWANIININTIECLWIVTHI